MESKTLSSELWAEWNSLQAELALYKAAIAAGLIDLDCLVLADLRSLTLHPDNHQSQATEVLARLKLDKPALFRPTGSAPPWGGPCATWLMTSAEYVAALAELLRNDGWRR